MRLHAHPSLPRGGVLPVLRCQVLGSWHIRRWKVIGTCAAHISCNLMVTQESGRIIIELPLPGKCRSILNLFVTYQARGSLRNDPQSDSIPQPHPPLQRPLHFALSILCGTLEWRCQAESDFDVSIH